VEVVAARVHHAHVLSAIRRPHFRRERQVGGLRHGQGVHVGPHGDDGSGHSAFQQPDDAGARDAGLDFEPELAQVVGDQRGRLLLAVRQLGILVDLVADLRDRGRDLCRLLLDARERILRGRAGAGDRGE